MLLIADLEKTARGSDTVTQPDAATALIASALNRPIEEVAEVLKCADVWRRWTFEELSDMTPVQLATAVGECHAAGVHVPEWIFDSAEDVPGGKWPDTLTLNLQPEKIAEVKAFLYDHSADGCLHDYVDGLEKVKEWTRVCNSLFRVSEKGRPELIHSAIVDTIILRHYPITFSRELWLYHEDEGIYRREAGEIEALVADVATAAGIENITVALREIRAFIRGRTTVAGRPFDIAAWVIPVNNGVITIDPETGAAAMGPHSPEYRFTRTLPVNYVPDADTAFIREALEAWVSPDEAVYLLQLPVVAFLQTWGRWQKIAYLIEGERDAAKTTYCELLYEFFGEANVAQVSLARICEDRFGVAALVSKLINIYDELKAVPLKGLDRFKNVSGGRLQSIERKGVDSYSATISAPSIFTCNKPPAIKDLDDDAFWSRWVYVNFVNRFPRDDSFKERLFSDENLSAFLNLIINELGEVVAGRSAIARMDEETVKDIWTNAADDVARFVNLTFTREAAGQILKDAVYDAYRKFCQNEGIPVKAKNTFTILLDRMHIGVSRVRVTPRGKQIYHYTGIVWKTPEMAPAVSGGNATLEGAEPW